jgi:hypothetical protein
MKRTCAGCCNSSSRFYPSWSRWKRTAPTSTWNSSTRGARRRRRITRRRCGYVRRQTGIELESPDARKNLAKVFERCGIPAELWHKPDTGNATFTEDVLKRAAKISPIIQAIFEAGQLADLRSKYLDKYAKTVRRRTGGFASTCTSFATQRKRAATTTARARSAVASRARATSMAASTCSRSSRRTSRPRAGGAPTT